jgi:Orsellinic acid/F9775 biosynthesis cluster protein D
VKNFHHKSYAPKTHDHLILLISMTESIAEIAGKYVIYNSDLKVLICRKEKHCISPGANRVGESRNYGIMDHFNRSEHKDIPKKHRIALSQYISNLDIAKSHDVQIPPPETRPIAGLALYRGGAECLICNELTSDERQMKKHCRTKHNRSARENPIWKKQAVQSFFNRQGKELKYDY